MSGLVDDLLARMAEGRAPACFVEADKVRAEMAEEGASVPAWKEILEGAQPPPPAEGLDAADFDRGWQCHLCSFVETRFREQVVFPNVDEARRALLHSQAGGAASSWLRAIPSEQALCMVPLRVQTAIRRRLRWPLPLSGGVCCRGCRKDLDIYGDRAAACSMAGRIKVRSVPLEKTWARVLREAKGRVRERVLLRDAALPGIDPIDGRHIEVVVTGLPAARGIPLAVDATMISPLHADGTAWGNAADQPGASFARALRSKQQTYPELVGSSVLQLWVVATEIGGRLNKTALELLRAAAAGRAQHEPAPLRRQAARAWEARWTTLLAVAAQNALCATLVQEGSKILDAPCSAEPLGVDVWLDGVHAWGPRSAAEERPQDAPAAE